jgi:hypothetical protein
MTLFTNENNQIGTPATISLTPGAQVPQYLYQAFPTASDTSWRGRVDIQSNIPVSMLALSQAASGQYSSLPLASTVRNYSVTSTSSYNPFAQMTLWTEGLFVQGYAISAGYPDELWGIFGQIATDGTLHFHFDGDSAATEDVEIFGYVKTNQAYTPGLTSFTGTYWVSTPSGYYSETGTFTATLVP